MKIVLITEVFPPLCISGAVQLRDLSREFVHQGHELTVLLPDAGLDHSWQLENLDGMEILRLRALRTRDIGYVRRTMGEFLMPFFMWYNLRKSPLNRKKWDGIVWYAPSIFHGPLVRRVKKTSDCKDYLILRDIFPEWAVDLGLMGRGLPYSFFDAVARYQYSIADVIGVQTPGNLKYFYDWALQPGRQLEVLQNWLSDEPASGCSINILETPLSGRQVFVYAGNMGVAQGMSILLDLAERLQGRKDIGFLFVGRGSDAANMTIDAKVRGLDNVLFHNEIHPDEIPGLYAQCKVGLIALDTRHKSHNIPGKFLTYMQSGLPVLASINAGNDLGVLIRNENVGRASEDGSVDTLEGMVTELINAIRTDTGMPSRCRSLYVRLFMPKMAVDQIVMALRNG
jgi:glycosyltransferase involved in cell wall biosynthesis